MILWGAELRRPYHPIDSREQVRSHAPHYACAVGRQVWPVQMSAWGQTRSSGCFRYMSAQAPQAEIQAAKHDVAAGAVRSKGIVHLASRPMKTRATRRDQSFAFDRERQMPRRMARATPTAPGSGHLGSQLRHK